MTLSYIEYPDTKTVEIHVDGKVAREEFDSTLAKMDLFIQNNGTIKLLESVTTFKVGMDMHMLWEGMKFDLKNIRHISHCAVVSDIGWISPMSKAAGAFMSTKLRTFNMDEIDAARAWLKDPDAGS
ncbi:MAG: STAS/SEC14 domain-containing protein [Marinosulfonomonas sp.]|nr:STAS/SEC14 domain-containing protein [Marinosulfonomonas sp.]